MPVPLGNIFEEAASNAVSSDNEDEDEAMGQMMKRISVMSTGAPRPSVLQGMMQSVSPPGAAPGDLAKANLVTGFTGQTNQPTLFKAGKKSLTMLKMSPTQGKKMFEGLGSIEEIMEDAEETVRVDSSVDRDILGQLRRDAEQGDENVDRYSTLVQQSMNIVSEVKSALYDADDSPQDFGAELLLEEVRDMLINVSQTSLAEAAQLQKTAENWLGVRKRMAYQLKNNHTALEVSIERRAESARESNAENRAECDRLWRKIQDLESEVDSLSKLKMQGSTATPPLSPVSNVDGAFDANGAPTEGGLTLEGAHSLLRSLTPPSGLTCWILFLRGQIRDRHQRPLHWSFSTPAASQ